MLSTYGSLLVTEHLRQSLGCSNTVITCDSNSDSDSDSNSDSSSDSNSDSNCNSNSNSNSTSNSGPSGHLNDANETWHVDLDTGVRVCSVLS